MRPQPLRIRNGEASAGVQLEMAGERFESSDMPRCVRLLDHQPRRRTEGRYAAEFIDRSVGAVPAARDPAASHGRS